MAWMAADLTGQRVPGIIIGGNTTGVRAMRAATQSVPIVSTTGVDPNRTARKRMKNTYGAIVFLVRLRAGSKVQIELRAPRPGG
jgi:hypothetical protein